MSLPPSVPSPPLSLMAVDIGSSTVCLTWSPPTEPNGILLFYRVMARQMGGDTEWVLVDILANTSTSNKIQVNANESDTADHEDLPTANAAVAFTLSGLSPRTDYVITVKANTSAGYGNRSEELHIQTAAGRRMCTRVCVSEWYYMHTLFINSWSIYAPSHELVFVPSHLSVHPTRT